MNMICKILISAAFSASALPCQAHQWCIAESARLEAWKADLLARIKAASGQ